MKNVLRMSVLLLATISLFIFSYQSQVETSASVNAYESRRMIKEEVYYTTVEPVEPHYIVTEREIAGIMVSEIDYKKVKKYNNRWKIELTNDEIDLLAKIVWTEARGECDKGQQAVCEVIFNRMIYDKEFKGSLTEVLSQKIGGSSQFCSWKLRNDAKPTDKEYDNIQKVLNGETDILDFDTVYFSTSPRNDDIADHIGGHYFCDYELKD